MRAEIVSIGTELLLGQIVDTNSAYIAERLAELGIDVYYISTVGDNRERLKSRLEDSLQRADIVITTGGLGPTDDDLTREVIAEVCGVELIKKENLVKQIEDFFAELGREMTENNLSQAYLPAGAKPIINSWGTAPGILMEHQEQIIFSTPGVPREMREMMEETIIPYLEERMASKELIKSKVLKVCGYGESTLEAKIKDILQQQSNPTIALLAGKSQIKLRITAKAESEKEAQSLITKEETRLRARLKEAIFAVDEETMEEVVAVALKEQGLRLAAAESCTGGLISHRLTNVPGSSKYFKQGVVAYSKQAKKELLAVSNCILAEYGVVSPQVAEEMALGVKELAQSDLGLGITGLAGPSGGSKEKPIGLVYFALANQQGVSSFKFKFHGKRMQVKELAAQYALDKLRRYLIGELEL
ncbi:competence/damage-inducible protein A [Fuchsiella alkaliacetigena]|uniref:competence/damage-inducible protein A n=1 Tax=Fuchsiella alkaliacetigena TaxID=957042 RepID=UPI00200A049E|nr:competence/damage-inducible protein A [Fuchsiella alkaliacetigena]MCK8824265.1 competence/damage-inducible protein A [Fuchsiella alkaliacetigena]